MLNAISQLPTRLTIRLHSWRRPRRDDRGASVVETVIIAAALAALAISAMAAIKALVDVKVANITL